MTLVVITPFEPRLERGITKRNMTNNCQPQLPATEINGGPIEGGPDSVKGSESESHGGIRKKVVVVGLGMVGISFM
jgi:nitrite reductase (NAD(P)H)